MQQHETLSSIYIMSFHLTLTSIIQLYHLEILVKYQTTYYLYNIYVYIYIYIYIWYVLDNMVCITNMNNENIHQIFF